MADLNLDFGDGALQTGANAGGSNGGTQDITGSAAKNAETDITNKDNNNNGNNGEGNNNGGTDGNNNQGNQGGEGNNNNGEREQTTDSSTGGSNQELLLNLKAQNIPLLIMETL